MDFKNRTSSGRHLIVDIKNIQDLSTITDPSLIEDLLDAICSDLELTIIRKSRHIFEQQNVNDPIALTAVYLLSESHISIHTYPEKNFVAFDLYTCRDYENDDILKQLALFLIQAFTGDETSTVVIHNRLFH